MLKVSINAAYAAGFHHSDSSGITNTAILWRISRFSSRCWNLVLFHLQPPPNLLTGKLHKQNRRLHKHPLQAAALPTRRSARCGRARTGQPQGSPQGPSAAPPAMPSWPRRRRCSHLSRQWGGAGPCWRLLGSPQPGAPRGAPRGACSPGKLCLFDCRLGAVWKEGTRSDVSADAAAVRRPGWA